MVRTGTRTFILTLPLRVEVTASGCYDKGVTHLRPEDCRPPYGECAVDSACVLGLQGDDGQLDPDDVEDARDDIERAFFLALLHGGERR